MQISAVGGMGAGAAGGAGSAAAAGGSAGLVGPAAAGASAPGSLDGAVLPGTVPAGMEMLSDVAGNFGETSFLFTLLILALLDKGDREGGGAAGAIGFLAGLALASQLGQTMGNQPGQPIEAAAGGAGLGGQLDVSA